MSGRRTAASQRGWSRRKQRQSRPAQWACSCTMGLLTVMRAVSEARCPAP